MSSGEHEFDFRVDKDFFLEFGNTSVIDAQCDVKISLDRRSDWMEASFDIGGSVVVECDRCLDNLTLPVEVEEHLIIRFDKDVQADDEAENDDIMSVEEGENELDLSQCVYDYICLSFPIQRVHPEGKCNPVMIDKLQQNGRGGEEHNEDDYSPFSGLKDLLNKKNN